MTTPIIERSRTDKRTDKQPLPKIPPLENGDHLTRAEFERRYEASPHIKKAELIEGVVYVSSPVRLQQHGRPHGIIVGWLFYYEAATPGVQVADNVTVRLDMDNEPQPDAFLRLKEKVGGQSSPSADDYLEGTPELVVEVAASSATYDLHDKMNAYRRNGVQEYLVLLTRERKTLWYVLEEGTYHLLQPENGLLKSRVFPGLYLHTASYWDEDLPQLLKCLQEGLDSPRNVSSILRHQNQEFSER